MAVTISDVAKEANVAASTISKYMNGGSVRKRNKEAIEKAIHKLGYHPNTAARGLRSSRTYTIGLVTDTLENQYFAKITGQIERCLKERGYTVFFCCHRNSPEKAQKAVETLVGKQVDGILLISIAGGEACIHIAREAKIPIVSLDREVRGEAVDYVMSNSASGVYEAVEYLIQKGHERIGILTGRSLTNAGLFVAEERFRGYIRAMEDYNLPIDRELVSEGDFSFESGYRCMMELWNRKARPTAVFVCNYNMCLGAITAIHNLKIKIPEELSFATFDDLEFSVMTQPGLTAVRQKVEEISKCAVELILKRINGDYSDYPRKLKIKTVFKERESVKT